MCSTCNHVLRFDVGLKHVSKIQSGNEDFLCVNTYISNCCTIGDMGWTDLSLVTKMNMLRFWNNMIGLLLLLLLLLLLSNERLINKENILLN